MNLLMKPIVSALSYELSIIRQFLKKFRMASTSLNKIISKFFLEISKLPGSRRARDNSAVLYQSAWVRTHGFARSGAM